jgi:single-strand DNA-binding protein
MINMAQILGRVGKIDTRTAGSGMKICNVSMVTSKKFTKNGEKQEKVTWHNVTLFSKLAEIAEKYVNVGDLFYVQGEMDNQKYTTQDGLERTKFFVIGHDIKLIPKSKEHVPAPKSGNVNLGTEKSYEEAFGEDSIPF